MNFAAAGLQKEADQFLASMPGNVAETFSVEQHRAIGGALHQRAWRRPRVNIRISLPLLSRHYFFALV